MNLSAKMILELAADAETILVEACKYDNTVHRTWKVRLIEESQELWTFIGIFEKEVRHPLLGIIRPKTISLEYYWKNRCYNVFKFHEPEGTFRNYYCNVNLPPVLSRKVLSYVDLDVDILVQPDLSYQILDLDEFAENSVKHNYPPPLIATVNQSINELIDLIETQQFPFSV